MPPRFAYWTILAGGLPTAFRAAELEDLLPTFRRIQEKHPDAEIKYFARGKLWASREAASQDLADRRRRAVQRDAPAASAKAPANRQGRERERWTAPSRPGRRAAPDTRNPRGRDWRPGGDHRDPRQRFNDARKQRQSARRKQRWQLKQVDAPPRRRRTRKKKT